MFAIIQSGGRQYRSTGRDRTVDRVGEAGASVTVEQVLLVGTDGGEVLVGAPFVAGARVVGVVVDAPSRPEDSRLQEEAPQAVRRTKGHRSALTRIQVTDILV